MSGDIKDDAPIWRQPHMLAPKPQPEPNPVWFPTPELRWVRKKNTLPTTTIVGETEYSTIQATLQQRWQKWVVPLTDETEWRDVPIHEEEA